jgi:hypothetical protein
VSLFFTDFLFLFWYNLQDVKHVCASGVSWWGEWQGVGRERERVTSSPSQPPMAISLITVPCLAVWSSACLHHGMSRSVHKILHVSPSTTCLVCLCVPRLRKLLFILYCTTMYEASLRDSEGAEVEHCVSGASLQQRCQFVGG